MKRLLPLVLMLGCRSPAADSGAAEVVVPYDVEARQWTARPLLVFGPSEDDDRVRTQLTWIDVDVAGLAERAMDDVRVIGLRGQANGTPMTPGDVSQLRERFDVDASDFAVVLVGKDGGEKLRSEQPIALSEVFAVIDAMPMRQREMAAD